MSVLVRERNMLKLLGEKARAAVRLVELLTPSPLAAGASSSKRGAGVGAGASGVDEAKVSEALARFQKAAKDWEAVREKERARKDRRHEPIAPREHECRKTSERGNEGQQSRNAEAVNQ